ncbi:HAMP domain-containing protein [Sphaerotilus sp.]|uniref:HAMP domain-containing protein n=1 Tax=Sphaerotilus sp. TaxID=2093942 RepID=UPI002ACF088B|nr:HAMP domain-containing protein [Sphaerotilus sp.]MDZ7858291.1 HAMP domain-containing protein [Sphaerotilus sp.]
MEHHFRQMSIRARLAFGTMLPLALATGALMLAWAAIGEGPAASKSFALLSGALMCLAIGSGCVLHHINARSVLRPLDKARQLTQALVRGQYGERVRIDRLDEAGRLLVALEELGDYLAVVLPEESTRSASPSQPSRNVPRDSLERIAEQLRQSGEAFAAHAELQTTGSAPAQPRAGTHLRLVVRQA